jgi:hypothetical protein
MSPEIDYPRRIANIWKGIPESVSAAFSWGSGKSICLAILSLLLEMFFVDAGELYRFDSFKMAVARGYPRRFSSVFDYCLPRVEA